MMLFAMKRDDALNVLAFLRTCKNANIYVDVETGRRLFHILEREQYSTSMTNWRLHRLIEYAIEQGYEVLWLHIYDSRSGGWRKYPLILDDTLYGLAT